ncbi:MAG: hypothetical protein AB1758_35435, partial [Candidatus Eremiobacterota bacterium]
MSMETEQPPWSVKVVDESDLLRMRARLRSHGLTRLTRLDLLRVLCAATEAASNALRYAGGCLVECACE